MGEYLKGYEVGFAAGMLAASFERAKGCDHDWKDIDSQSDNAVRCTKCSTAGERQRDGTVYWPAT